MSIPLTINITANKKIRDTSGNVIASGWITVFPVGKKINNFAYISGSGELVTNSSVKRSIVNGAMVGTLTVDNPQVTNPANFGYNFVLQDNNSSQTVQFPQVMVTPDANGNFDLADIVPLSSTPFPVLYRTGPQGIPGVVGVGTFTFTCLQTVLSFEPVACIAGYAYPASNLIPAHLNNILGIALISAGVGENVNVQYSGPVVNSNWNWIMNQPIYAGPNGTLTQLAPTAGFSQILGLPVNNTTMLLNPQVPIIIV